MKSKITVDAKVKATGKPSSDDLAAINKFSLRELSASEVYTRSMILAHNAIDRDGDVFDSALLDDFSRTLPGKGLFVKHPRSIDGDSGPGIGCFYAAKIITISQEAARTLLKQPDLRWPTPDEMAILLEASFYIMTVGNAELIAKIDGGIATYASIGFTAQQRVDVVDANGSVIAHRLLSPGEALEGSLVWLGAQPGARIHKSAKREIFPVSEDFRSLRDPSVTAKALEYHYGIKSTHTEIKSAPARKGSLRDPGITAKALKNID